MFINSTLKKRERNWAETSVTVTWDREKIGQWLTDASLITIPETLPGRISSPVVVNRKVRFHFINSGL